jgi:hypothetical protein
MAVWLGTPAKLNMANDATWDNVSSNVPLAIGYAAKWTGASEVGISATTGGDHDAGSRHYPANWGGTGMAADVYSLNGKVITAADSTGQVARFQAILNHMPEARENFGPARVDKNGTPYCTSGSKDCKALTANHKDHVHYSVNK